MTINLKNLALAAVASVLLGVFMFSVAYADTSTFSTNLTGAQEVPPVGTSTSAGSMTLSYDTSDGLGSNMMYTLSASGTGITMAHLHCAPVGVNGPAVVTLFHSGTSSPTSINGVLSSSTITNSKIMSVDCMSKIGFNIYDTEDLAQAIAGGKIYANIHTLAHPSGDSRGQLTGSGTSTPPGTGTTTPPTTGTSTPPTGTSTPPTPPPHDPHDLPGDLKEQLQTLVQHLLWLIGQHLGGNHTWGGSGNWNSNGSTWNWNDDGSSHSSSSGY